VRLLLVEDSEKLSAWLAKALQQGGYAVDVVHDGGQADRVLLTETYDAVVLDLELPTLDGLSVLRRLRGRGAATPVLVLTARGGLDDRVAGLNLGADDYLAKPFDLGELIARAKALIRRGKGSAHPVLSACGLELNTLEQTVRRDSVFVELSPTEYRILEYLMHRPRVIVSKRELLEHLYDYNWERHSNVIEAHVSNLRKKLDAALPEPAAVIETMRGRGYRLAPEMDLGFSMDDDLDPDSDPEPEA